MNYALALILTMAAPLVLLPIEQLLLVIPFIYVLEDVFKSGLIWHHQQNPHRTSSLSIGKVVVLGVVFTVSETTLYLTNFLLLNNFSLLALRLLLTGVLHVGTFLVMFFGRKKGAVGLSFGFILSALIHIVFNEWLAS